MLKNTPNQTAKFRTKTWVEMMTRMESTTLIVKLNLKLQC